MGVNACIMNTGTCILCKVLMKVLQRIKHETDHHHLYKENKENKCLAFYPKFYLTLYKSDAIFIRRKRPANPPLKIKS